MGSEGSEECVSRQQQSGRAVRDACRMQGTGADTRTKLVDGALLGSLTYAKQSL